MKRNFLLATVVLLLTSCDKNSNREVVSAESPAGQMFSFMPIIEDGVTDITIAIAWPTQWAYVSDNNPATPYIAAEAILSGGTEELLPQQIAELFADKNASGRLTTRAKHVIGELSFPKEHIEDVVSMASDMLAEPQFDPDWISRIKEGLLTNQEQSQAQTSNEMWATARAAILGNGPLNDFLSLPLDAIEAVEDVDLRRWHAETLVKAGVTVTVTGAISRQEAGKAIDQLLSGLPDGEDTATLITQPNFLSRTILLHLPDAEKSTLGFIGQLPSTVEGGDLTDLLALNFFARSGNGPLFDAVRTRLGATYGLQAGFVNYDRDIRIMVIGGEIETSKVFEASELVLDVYKTYRADADLSGLDSVRDSLADSIAKSFEFVDVAAMTMLELALDNRDVGEVTRIGELVKDIQAEDVRTRLASAFPLGDELIIFGASSDRNALPGACVVTEIEQAAQCP